jgi:WhiB family redox-sensing transcriptional regulator
MIGWVSYQMATTGKTAGSNTRVHADQTCGWAPDPLAPIEVQDGRWLRPGRPSLLVEWCENCRAPSAPGEWARRGACVGAPVDLFFPKKKGYRRAREMCARCPVLTECRTWALEEQPSAGMWGGLTARERGAK